MDNKPPRHSGCRFCRRYGTAAIVSLSSARAYADMQWPLVGLGYDNISYSGLGRGRAAPKPGGVTGATSPEVRKRETSILRHAAPLGWGPCVLSHRVHPSMTK